MNSDAGITTIPPRRWLSFTLRTSLFFLTIGCLWFGWQVNTVHRRKTMRAQIEQNGGTVDVFARPEPFSDDSISLVITSYQRVLGPEAEPEIPRWRRWLGDEAVNIVTLPTDSSDSELANATSLFPEAEVKRRQMPRDETTKSGFF